MSLEVISLKKKTLLISVSSILVLSVVVFLLISFSNNSKKYAQAEEIIKEYHLDTNPTDFIYQTSKVKDTDSHLPSSASEEQIISFMHKMTHQKIRSREKDGAVEMTDENIEKAEAALRNNTSMNSETKEELKEILKRWKMKNFIRIDHYHDLLNKMEGATIGNSTGVMSKEEEEIFVENNFR